MVCILIIISLLLCSSALSLGQLFVCFKSAPLNSKGTILIGESQLQLEYSHVRINSIGPNPLDELKKIQIISKSNSNVGASGSNLVLPNEVSIVLFKGFNNKMCCSC
jgi:hypothetical protein